MVEDVSYLQLNTCKSGALHTSKRTAPQWQPPVCFTRPSRSLQTTDHLHQETVCASLAHVFTNVCNQQNSFAFLRDCFLFCFFVGSKINTRVFYVCQCSFFFSITVLSTSLWMSALRSESEGYIAYLSSLVMHAIRLAPLTYMVKVELFVVYNLTGLNCNSMLSCRTLYTWLILIAIALLAKHTRCWLDWLGHMLQPAHLPSASSSGSTRSAVAKQAQTKSTIVSEQKEKLVLFEID